MSTVSQDDALLISGIQHFAFCRRQWALIHIEQQWADNLRTVEGQILHRRAHEAGAERRGDVLTVRDMAVFSNALGIRGKCDVVEFHRDDGGVELRGPYGQKGALYKPIPIEYKRGKPKEEPADLLQLCAQALCLEEMLCCTVEEGRIFYGETRRRLSVLFDDDLRSQLKSMLGEMRDMYGRGFTPKVKTGKHCNACSLRDACLPKLCREMDVDEYIDGLVKEQEP